MDAKPKSADNSLWKKLLPAIAAGEVIPIVGRDLLRIVIDGREMLLSEYLATQLAQAWGVECGPSTTLDEIVVAHLEEDEDASSDEVYPDVLRILNGLKDSRGAFPVPEPLRKLAGIAPLRLFLSTTVDPLLAGALGSPASHVFAYAPNAPVLDIPKDYARSPHRTVFQLFGKLTGTRHCALLEEDTLEFLWNIQAETSSRLSTLFDEVRTKSLLFIGNGHADWLARFFVRLARKDRLSFGANTREFIADREVSTNDRLRGFLKNFSPQTRTFGTNDPVEFVNLLAEKWDAFPDKPADDRPPAASTKAPAVFISYASEDREAVLRLHAQLEAAGLVTWFDRARLESGDPWWPVIEENIRTCEIFLPVLSANTNARDEGIVFREWNRAFDRLEDRDKARARLIHPVIVDGTAAHEVSFSRFSGFNFERALGGEAASEFISRLRELVRARRAQSETR